MKILAMVHGYPPLQNAGAEWMLHEMLKYLSEQGHYCEVRLPISEIKPYKYEGVNVEVDEWRHTKNAVQEADLIISHLDRAGRALNVCEAYRKPFVQVIHNTNKYDILNSKHREMNDGRFVYVVYNSEFTFREMRYRVPGIIVRPPVDSSRYRISKRTRTVKIKEVQTKIETVKADNKPFKRGENITLINLFVRKGGVFFGDIARMMPDHQFLGVEGGYGKQEKTNLPNVKYLGNTPQIRDVYAQTRILLMPSQYESYGRTGVEAMSAGIPVIANPTPGLKESLGGAGIFCDLKDPKSWVEAIKALDDEKTYNEASKKCLARYAEIEEQSDKELKELEIFLQNIIDHKA